MMKKTYLLMLSLLIAGAANLKSQVTIGSLDSPKATLDVVAAKTDGTTAEGIIAPRLTLSQLYSARDCYTSAQNGAIVYVTDLTGGTATGKTAAIIAPGYYFFDGTNWQPFVSHNSSNGWLTTGNANTVPGTNFIGTTDNNSLRFKINNTASGDIGTGMTAFGYQALMTLTGSNNSAFGVLALSINTTGGNNSAFGNTTLAHNTTGSYNSAFGDHAEEFNTTGTGNDAFGCQALNANSGASYNDTFGYQALNNTSGNQNCGFGFKTLLKNGNGTKNTAVGYFSMGDTYPNGNTCNTAVGDSSLMRPEGNYNTAIGYNALSTTSDYLYGSYNTAIGVRAGSTIPNSAGTRFDGSYNIFIGADAQPSSLNVSGEITIGSAKTTKARLYAPAWQFVSDSRLSHNIQPIGQGLDFVLKLQPVEFVLNNRSDGTKSLGFMAQDVQDVMSEASMSGYDMVSNMDANTLGLSTGELIPILTKAIQEQQTLIEQLEARIAALEEAK